MKNKNKLNQKNDHPIENQKTAAWANIASLKSESSVPIPSESEVIDAKEWSEDNEK